MGFQGAKPLGRFSRRPGVGKGEVAVATVSTEDNEAQSSASEGLFDGWPGWTKPVFLFAVVVVWVGAPMATIAGAGDSSTQSGGVFDYEPMMAVLIALTTATIAAIFLFMTFRIDRGTRFTAERHAKKAAEDFLRLKTDELIREITRDQVDLRLTNKMLREELKAVLMVDANGQIVDEYVRQPIERLDAETVGQVVDRLSETIEAWRRRDDRRGWWARTKARFQRFAPMIGRGHE